MLQNKNDSHQQGPISGKNINVLCYFHKSARMSINNILNEDKKLKLLSTDKTEKYVL